MHSRDYRATGRGPVGGDSGTSGIMQEQAQLACNEVWGGNAAADAALELPGVRGWVFSHPYQNAEAGGDVYYVSSCGTGRITRLMLADVMGHGDEAAEVGRYLRSLMRRYLNHIEPHTLASQVNDLFNARSKGDGRFATAVILTFFAPTGELTLCNAGHPPPIIYRGEHRQWSRIERLGDTVGPSDLPLGVHTAGTYSARELTLEPGDTVLLYTDGLIEAKNDQGQRLYIDGLIPLLNEMGDPAAWDHPGSLAARLTRLLEERGYELSEDDLSLVVLHCSDRSGGAPLTEKLRSLGPAVRGLLHGESLPWPELSLQNVGGAMFPPLNHVRPRKRHANG